MTTPDACKGLALLVALAWLLACDGPTPPVEPVCRETVWDWQLGEWVEVECEDGL